MALSEAELARAYIAALQKLNAKGLLAPQQFDNLIRENETRIKAESTPASSTASQTAQPASTGSTALDMGVQSEAATRMTDAGTARASSSAENTASPRTVPVAPKSSRLSAEVKPWSVPNYTTVQSTGKGWATEEQLALARAEHDSMMSSGDKNGQFRSNSKTPFKPAATAPAATNIDGQSTLPTFIAASSPIPVDVTPKHTAQRPPLENYVPPHMRLAESKLAAVASESWQTVIHKGKSVAKPDSTKPHANGAVSNISVQEKKTAGVVKDAALPSTSLAMSAAVAWDQDKTADVTPSLTTTALSPMSTSTSTVPAKPIGVSKVTTITTAFAPIDQKQHPTYAPKLSVSAIDIDDGNDSKTASGDHSATRHVEDEPAPPSLLSTVGKLVAEAQHDVNKFGTKAQSDATSEKREHSALEAKIDHLISMVTKQQAIIVELQSIVDDLKLTDDKHELSITTCQKSNTQLQSSITAVEKSLAGYREASDDHCDRIIDIESTVEIYKAIGTNNTTTPFAVNVQYPDKSIESIQTFGTMPIGSLLERAMRRKKIPLDDTIKTVTLTYLGERLGHLSLVGEHDFQENVVVQLDHTRA